MKKNSVIISISCFKHEFFLFPVASSLFPLNFNLKDFPSQNISQYGIEAQHPDQFILHLIDLNSQLVCQAVKNQLNTLKNPPMILEELLEVLRKQQLFQSVIILRELLF
ncbi:MAG: hypothetical protein HCA25_07775 [Dolichospermum sp. DET50]|nr:hypothetical protein [Dolichospermum sp. DET66]MBS3032182.1 hypothetical protein [Dolichospermum sp. DET67]MBS3037386.1 hypothetical protein [Dolichospermum sp. DET50]QSX69369.1 MAG: hypothetical protein EZY12_07000 [Dolichospermum sp. DET69]